MAFAFEALLPTWMTYSDGEVPLLFVAPHGGRRPADAPILDSIKVNDLHTAALTTELATRTRGYALINHALDRNALDLNRISQVRRHAPWFLSALVELLSALVEQHGAARVFFIHGWNVVQPVCDLGMGLKQHGKSLVQSGKAAPTLSPQFLATTVLPFRDTAIAQGIDVAIGRRYPAADKNNVMQLFSGRFAEDSFPAVQTLAQFCTSGKVNALQCELGVGLRWPGVERERFIQVFCQTLGNFTLEEQTTEQTFSTVSLSPVRPPVIPQQNGTLLPVRHPQEPRRFGLHFHDPVSGLGLMGGIESSPSHLTHSGRLMLSLGGTEMVLFTGEDDGVADLHHLRIGDLLWQSQPDGLTISYRGSVMRFSHPQAFIRLEEGLAASWIEPATITLHLTLPSPLPTPPSPLFLAHLRGEVTLRDRCYAIDAWGFLDMLTAEETGRLQPRRLLSLPFGSDLGIFLSWTETAQGPRSSGILYHHGIPHALRPEDWCLRYDFVDGRPSTFHLSVLPTALLPMECTGETVTAIPVVRHATAGSALAVTFGLSRTIWQDREARGIYEYSEWRKDDLLE